MRLTEDQIERQVERMLDELDRRYMRGEVSTDNYQAQAQSIDAWAKGQYSNRRAALVPYVEVDRETIGGDENTAVRLSRSIRVF